MFLALQGLGNGFNGSAQAYIILVLHFRDLVGSHGGHSGGTEAV